MSYNFVIYLILKVFNIIKTLKMELYYAPIAQWLEQIPLKDKVQGSNPCGGTKTIKSFLKIIIFFVLLTLVNSSKVSSVYNKGLIIV